MNCGWLSAVCLAWTECWRRFHSIVLRCQREQGVVRRMRRIALCSLSLSKPLHCFFQASNGKWSNNSRKWDFIDLYIPVSSGLTTVKLSLHLYLGEGKEAHEIRNTKGSLMASARCDANSWEFLIGR